MMETVTTSFVWLRPLWLWFIPGAWLLCWLLSGKRALHEPWRAVCDEHLYHALTAATTAQQRVNRAPQWVLAALLSVWLMALAGPSWQVRPLPVFQKDTVLVIALDLSQAMRDDDVPASRLKRAQFKLHDLLTRLTQGNVGLLAYTRQAFVASPLTTDTNTLIALLPALQPQIMPVGGSDVNQALLEAERLIAQSGRAGGQVLVTTAAQVPDAALITAKRLARVGIKTHVYALRDSPQYVALVQAGSGTLQRFSHDDSDVRAWLSTFANAKTTQTNNMREALPQRLDQGYWFLLMSMALLMPLFRRGWFEEVLG